MAAGSTVARSGDPHRATIPHDGDRSPNATVSPQRLHVDARMRLPYAGERQSHERRNFKTDSD